MKALSTLAPGILLLWAGLSLGGSLIATPAKFQAPSLSLATALEVGRATFQWMGVAEAALCAVLIVALFLRRGAGWRLALVPIGLFAVQRLAVMQALDARTLAVIAGENVGESSLHGLYVVLEVGKFLALLVLGAVGLTWRSGDA